MSMLPYEMSSLRVSNKEERGVIIVVVVDLGKIFTFKIHEIWMNSSLRPLPQGYENKKLFGKNTKATYNFKILITKHRLKPCEKDIPGLENSEKPGIQS